MDFGFAQKVTHVEIANLLIATIIIMKTIQVTLDDDIHRHAKSLALTRGITLGELVRQAVAALIERGAPASSTPESGRTP